MFKDTPAFSGFAVKDLDEAKKFYGETLGVTVETTPMGLNLKIHGGNDVFVYSKEDFEPATYTILNFVVKDIDKAVADLKSKGISFEKSEWTDEQGVARGLSAHRGPDIAWFKDPAGNFLSVLQPE
jgi:predicted enzyme related to lactoylglutathione lyase